jgi:hypothetical protein
MADILPSATPEKGGDDKTAANATSNEHGGKPKNKLKPRQTRSGKASLTWTQIIECGGTGLVFWLWGEIIHCHDISELCFYALALTVFQAGTCHFIFKLFKRFGWSLRLAFSSWIVLTILTWGVVWENSRPPKEAIANPPFVFLLPNSDDPEDVLKLTNDCFAPHGWGVTHIILGGVLIPMQIGQTNFLLTLRVRATTFAEQLEVFATVPAEWNVVAGLGWMRAVDEDGKAYSESNGILEPRRLRSLGYRSPIDLLPGDGLTLPSILFTNLEALTLNPLKTHSPNFGAIVLVAKAKGLPPAGVAFRPFFLQTSNGYSFKPIAVTLFPSNNEVAAFFPFPLRETNEMQK